MSQNAEQRDDGQPVDPDFDPLDADYLADPYPYYARFRSEAPVFYAPKIDFWVVSRYEDIVDIVKDPETSRPEGAVGRMDARRGAGRRNLRIRGTED
jgi:cytochrome P450